MTMLRSTAVSSGRRLATTFRPALIAADACRRSFATKFVGSDPLHLLQHECHARGLCDEDGKRIHGEDWRMVLALSPQDDRPPNVRTVSVECVSSNGLDFVIKQGSSAALAIQEHAPVAFLHSQGKFLPGQSAEQWRGEGVCTTIDLEEIIDRIPRFTLISLVGSKRLLNEHLEPDADEEVSTDRAALNRKHKSHFVEVLQKTRNDLEANAIGMDEFKSCLQPFRLQPTRVECMIAGPDSSVMWDRWEWLRSSPTEDWKDPKQLVPH